MLFVVFYPVRIEIPLFVWFSEVLNYLAELDTIYRHTDTDEEEQEEKESTKINEYLTYNWYDKFALLFSPDETLFSL